MNTRSDAMNWALATCGIILIQFTVGILIIQLADPPRMERVEAVIGGLFKAAAVIILLTGGLSLATRRGSPVLGSLLGIVFGLPVVIIAGLAGALLQVLLASFGVQVQARTVGLLLMIAASIGLLATSLVRTPKSAPNARMNKIDVPPGKAVP